MGAFKLEEAVEYQVKEIENIFVRLPNRDTKDAWVEATPAIQTAAAEECRQAAGADHIRQINRIMLPVRIYLYRVFASSL